MFAQKGFKYISNMPESGFKNVFVNKVGPDQAALVSRVYSDYEISGHTQVELVLYARAAALKRFCKQSRSRSGGSCESCLIRVFSVLLRGI